MPLYRLINLTVYSVTIVRAGSVKYSANLRKELRYLIFLSYNQTNDEYFVLGDGYGIREINSKNQAWNIASSQFEQIYIEAEIRSTEEGIYTS